ncbi:MAG: hypothetical protein KatS3mg111_4219 [Pirellulaceae bacterium]|nr:MAG: hypothetical protein KatS3mg111_4219 [Pirellulaceae bacterium]
MLGELAENHTLNCNKTSRTATVQMAMNQDNGSPVPLSRIPTKKGKALA